MTKERFHEESLKILKKKSRNQTIIGGISTSAVILILLTALFSFGSTIRNHEGRISTQEEITKGILDNSDINVIVRSEVDRVIEPLKEEIDSKASKDSYDLIIKKLDRLEDKIDEIKSGSQ